MKTNPMNTMLNFMKPTNVFLLGLGLLLPVQPNLWAQSVSHHFTSIAKLPDNAVTLSLGGSVSNLFASFYDLYVIEASPNLTNWMPLAILVRTNAQANTLLLTDTNAAQLDRRFYRIFTNHLITPFPKPTGPYAVGTFSRLVTDPSQTDRYGIEANSSFMVSFWYPAVAEAHLLPGAYLEMNLAKESAWASFGVDTRTMPHFVAHSLPEAAVLSEPAPFPVVIYSHGKGVNRKMNTRTVEELASHGYLVVGIDHQDCYATQFPDGRYLYGSFSSVSAAIASRIKDVQFVLEELVRMNAGNSPLAARINLERIGLLGMSLGGAIAAEVGRTDARIQCVALLDGALRFEVNTQLPTVGVGKPFLAMNNANDPTYNFWPDSQAIYSVATDHAINLRIKDSSHMWFTDIAWIASPSTLTRRAALAMDACTLSFFNHYLKDQDDHAFEASNGQPAPIQQAYPEIIELKTK
jgi:dienelactone hydrolase